MAVDPRHMHEPYEHDAAMREHLTGSTHVASARRFELLREPFGVAQAVAMAMGVFFIVIGAVGLARAGMDSATSPAVEVARIGMTPLMAGIHLALGLVAFLGGSSRLAGRATMYFLGPLLIAIGTIVIIEPIRSLAADDANGVSYLITGGIALAAALATPAVAIEERSDIIEEG